MFASKIAKPQTKAAASSTAILVPRRSVLVARPFGGTTAEGAHMLQRSIGNQAVLRLMAEHAMNLTRDEFGSHNEQGADPATLTARTTTPGASWNFSKVSVFPPDRLNRPRQAPSPFTAFPPGSAIQMNPVVGPANDPLGRETNRSADQLMRRIPSREVSSIKGRSLCSTCAEEENRMLRMLKPADKRPTVSREIGTADGGKTTDAGPVSPVNTAGDAGTSKPVPTDKTPDAGPSCPAETVTIGGAVCGNKYGAVATYCLAGARGWWFKESVTDAPGSHCQGGGIQQTTNPIQSVDGCVSDDISDSNGPPSAVAPCTDKTLQTVFAGPTKAAVEQCRYNHDQIIDVTKTSAKGGTVTTTSGGQSTHCDWTA